ncbi:histidinol dehydrogenase [Candidatus Marinamargulisbacteria bacterium SCGC AAA071-K20]|nr:histidinol dehydrogenase [Candidatus Marinamargulisbacteria bacterium SCGC AAA071-K20]
MALKIINKLDTYLKKIHQLNKSESQVKVKKTLTEIKDTIISKKDKGVLEYCQKFDNVELKGFSLKVSKREINNAYKKVSPEFITAIKKAKANITDYHKKQKPKNWEASPEDGKRYGIQYSALETVGLYVPGGRAPYFSTVLMNCIPALVAGVTRPIICTPPQQDGKIAPQILVAADICGVTEIYKVGGAQAIFAMAYGTEKIPKVDKIVGPGNIYVDLAKQMVYGDVDIDKPAGPSDVLVVVEDERYASFAASEMLAQLEHDPSSIAITIASNEECLQAVRLEFTNQLKTLSKKEIILESMKNSGIILIEESDNIIKAINKVAAEHLVLLINNYKPILKQVKHAGSIFCGPYTPVTMGDYFSGPNHVLPTSGTARFASPLGVMDFVKYSSYMHCSKSNLMKASKHLKVLTELEGFDAHYNAVDLRLK